MLRCLAMVAALALCGPAEARFLLPRVDLIGSTPAAKAGMAVWSFTDRVEAAATTVCVRFCPGMIVPAAVSVSSCGCVFLRQTVVGATGENFNTTEVTITAATVSGNAITLTLPEALGKGIFYLRFDRTFGLVNPSLPGAATLQLCAPDGRCVASESYYVGLPADSLQTAMVTGAVSSAAGLAVPNALVMADSRTPPLFQGAVAGPQSASAEPLDTTVTAVTALTGQDGVWSMSLPVQAAGTDYWFRADVSYQENGALVTSATNSTPPSLKLYPGQAATLNITVPYR